MACECIDKTGYSIECCVNCDSSTEYDGFTGTQINQIESIVTDVFKENNVIYEAWIDGFMRGFKEGINHE